MVRFSVQTHPNLTTTTTSYDLFLFLPPGALSKSVSTLAQCISLPVHPVPSPGNPCQSQSHRHLAHITMLEPTHCLPLNLKPNLSSHSEHPGSGPYPPPALLPQLIGPRHSILFYIHPSCLSVTDNTAVQCHSLPNLGAPSGASLLPAPLFCALGPSASRQVWPTRNLGRVFRKERKVLVQGLSLCAHAAPSGRQLLSQGLCPCSPPMAPLPSPPYLHTPPYCLS